MVEPLPHHPKVEGLNPVAVLNTNVRENGMTSILGNLLSFSLVVPVGAGGLEPSTLG